MRDNLDAWRLDHFALAQNRVILLKCLLMHSNHVTVNGLLVSDHERFMLLMAPLECRRIVYEALFALFFHRLEQVGAAWLPVLQGPK